VSSRNHDFDPSVLAARIVQGAVEHAPVRLHGAIVATLQLYPSTASEIFDEALQDAAVLHGSGCVTAITDAVSYQVAGRPVAQLRHCRRCDAQTMQEQYPLGATKFVWMCTVCGRRTYQPGDP